MGAPTPIRWDTLCDAARDTIEREHKFVVPLDWVLPSLEPWRDAHEDEVVEQTATYYDTRDLRLVRAGASIRHREDGWTVKLPLEASTTEGLVRSEHVFAGPPGAPPAAALDLVAARVRSARLAPVARIHTVRHRMALHAPHPNGAATTRTPVAILTDDHCRVLEGRVHAAFREVELEIAPDAPGHVVAAIVSHLRAAGASDADPHPKVVRALGVAALSPPDVRLHEVGRPATVDGVIRHALSEAVLRLVTHDPVVRLGEDIEGVHQARVATRRMRSHLRTFRTLLDPEWAGGLRTELGWLGGELGAVRDADVLLARLKAAVARELDEPDRDAATPLVERVLEEQARRRATLLESLHRTRYVELLDRLVDAADRPRVVLRIGGNDETHLRSLARRPWRQLRKAIDELPDPTPDAALHAVRIRAKRARYAAEVVGPAFGKRARAFASALTDVQDVLGEHQDSVVAAAWLRDTALTLDDPHIAFAAGVLAAAEQRSADAARAAWPRVWRTARRKRLRSWL